MARVDEGRERALLRPGLADETKRDTQAAIKMLDEWEALLSQGQPEAAEQLNAVRDELKQGLPKKDGGKDGG